MKQGFPFAVALFVSLVPALGSGQEREAPERLGSLGLSVSVFSFLNGLGAGIVLDKPLDWPNHEGARFARLEGWSALAPDNGVGVALGLTFGSGLVRLGPGMGVFVESGEFLIGPGFTLGLGSPSSWKFQLRADFGGYVTTGGGIPVLRFSLGRLPFNRPPRE